MKQPKKLTAPQLARQEVDALFQAMTEDRDMFAIGCDTSELERFDEAFDNVLALLEKEERVTDKTDSYTCARIGVRAGYLIGVQVGLRLRGVGGAR